MDGGGERRGEPERWRLCGCFVILIRRAGGPLTGQPQLIYISVYFFKKNLIFTIQF
jgi:hypothetical protein